MPGYGYIPPVVVEAARFSLCRVARVQRVDDGVGSHLDLHVDDVDAFASH